MVGNDLLKVGEDFAVSTARSNEGPTSIGEKAMD